MAFPQSGPSSFQIAFGRIEQLRQAGQAAEAEALARELLQKDTNSVAVLNALAMLIGDRGEYEEAQSLMRSAIAGAPREAVLHNNLGSLLYASDALDDAQAAYRKAVELKPDYVEACYNLAVTTSALGDAEGALVAFRRVVANAPGYWQAQVQVAALLHARGDNQDALVALDAALPGAAQYYDWYYYRGAILHALGRHQDALVAFQMAIALKPRRFEAPFAMGGTLAAMGREDDAIGAYKQSIEVQPDYLPAHEAYNTLAHAMGRDVRKLQSYSFARSQFGDQPVLLLAEAELMLKLGDTQTAELLLKQAPQERADIANALGRTLVLAGRFDEAEDRLRQAVRAEPMTVAHYHELAVAMLRAGRFASARDILAQARALDPHHQATLGYLTLVQRQLGDSEFASLFDAHAHVREYELPVPSGFADAASFNAALAQQLAALHTRRMAPIDQTLRGGTQTAPALFERDVREVRLLRDAIQDAVADYIKSLPANGADPFLSRRAADFTFSGSWSCRLASGGYHTNHIHQEGWISSAYYAALPDSVSAGDQGGLKFGESKFGLAQNDTPLRRVQPKVGKLVLFPSYYWHGTEPFEAGDTRLTVAFDVMPAN